MAAAMGCAVAAPTPSSPTLFHRSPPWAACLGVLSASSPPFPCRRLSAKGSTLFRSNRRKEFLLLSSGNGNGRRANGARRLLGLASPSGKYIREDYLVKKVSAKEVEDLVRGERNVPLVLDFYATWCGPCIMMAQQLETLAVEYEKTVLFVKVDTDDEHEFACDMQVRGLPTLYFISPDPSKDAIRTEGLIPPEMIKNIIDNEM